MGLPAVSQGNLPITSRKKGKQPNSFSIIIPQKDLPQVATEMTGEAGFAGWLASRWMEARAPVVRPHAWPGSTTVRTPSSHTTPAVYISGPYYRTTLISKLKTARPPTWKQDVGESGDRPRSAPRRPRRTSPSAPPRTQWLRTPAHKTVDIDVSHREQYVHRVSEQAFTPCDPTSDSAARTFAPDACGRCRRPCVVGLGSQIGESGTRAMPAADVRRGHAAL